MIRDVSQFKLKICTLLDQTQKTGCAWLGCSQKLNRMHSSKNANPGCFPQCPSHSCLFCGCSQYYAFSHCQVWTVWRGWTKCIALKMRNQGASHSALVIPACSERQDFSHFNFLIVWREWRKFQTPKKRNQRASHSGSFPPVWSVGTPEWCAFSHFYFLAIWRGWINCLALKMRN